MSKLEERTEQLLAITVEDREEDDATHPIAHAEQGPNRFAMMTLFFSEKDGVQIIEDLELYEITVKYFEDGWKDVKLTYGPLYDWAVNYYKENY